MRWVSQRKEKLHFLALGLIHRQEIQGNAFATTRGEGCRVPRRPQQEWLPRPHTSRSVRSGDTAGLKRGLHDVDAVEIQAGAHTPVMLCLQPGSPGTGRARAAPQGTACSSLRSELSGETPGLPPTLESSPSPSPRVGHPWCPDPPDSPLSGPLWCCRDHPSTLASPL